MVTPRIRYGLFFQKPPPSNLNHQNSHQPANFTLFLYLAHHELCAHLHSQTLKFPLFLRLFTFFLLLRSIRWMHFTANHPRKIKKGHWFHNFGKMETSISIDHLQKCFKIKIFNWIFHLVLNLRSFWKILFLMMEEMISMIKWLIFEMGKSNSRVLVN